MTLPSMIRIFFAIELSHLAKEKVGKYISMLKKNARSNAIRWTKPENLHITLQFLAEVNKAHLPQLIATVKAEVSPKIKKALLSFGEIRLFPNPYRPRVIVVEVLPQERLQALAYAIGAGIKLLDYETERRPFRGHLTLGRIKHTQGVNLSFLSAHKTQDLGDLEMREVVLFRSDPKPEGSEYTVIERIALL